MRRLFALVVLVCSLAACGAAPAGPPSAQSVLDQLKGAGLSFENVKPAERPADTPLPNSYSENVVFTIPSLKDKGGQVFVCSSKQNCDAVHSYFDALKAVAGPYLYQSPSGLVVVQLNSGLAAAEAAKWEAAVKALK